jgi:hypothetical protein
MPARAATAPPGCEQEEKDYAARSIVLASYIENRGEYMTPEDILFPKCNKYVTFNNLHFMTIQPVPC